MAQDTPGLPEQQPNQASPIKQILNFLSSMQLGIILLLLLAVISVFATTQEMNTAIASVYTSWWFVGIMAFTALNLLLCTIERVGPLTRQAFKPKREMTVDGIKKMQINSVIKVKSPGDEPLAGVQQVFKSNGLQATVHETPEGINLFGERGKFGYFGSIVTHLSLLLILLGAMYGALTGFETRNGGMSGDNFFVTQGNWRADIGEVRMVFEKDPTVRPRVYSDVTITRNGKVIKEGTVSINDPLRFEGTSIYHSTFLWISEVKITDPATGTVEELKFFEGDRYSLDDKGILFESLAFFPDFTMAAGGRPTSKSYNPNRPVLAYRITLNGQQEPWDLLELNEPATIETPNGPVEITLTGFENAAVYSIAKNLGRPILFIGAVLMVLGLYMSFFLFPRRFWAAFDAKTSSLVVGGRGYRNRLGVEQIMERIESEIRNREGE